MTSPCLRVIAEYNFSACSELSKKSRFSVHELRSTCDAILVGRRTIQSDNPSLTSHGVGTDPKIVILDPSSKVNEEYKAINKNTIHLTN